MSGLDTREQDVLAYYGREATGHRETLPLAGLPLAAFRAARERLVRKGVLARNPRGRYVPIDGRLAAR